MTSQTIPKMSLVAQFDDLCRSSSILHSGSEEEFKIFVENQLKMKRNMRELQDDLKKLSDKNSSLETEIGRFELQMTHLRKLLEEEVNKRKKVEREKKSMERQITLIKEVLLADNRMDDQTRERLALLSATCKASSPCLETIEESIGSLLSVSDIDETDDDITVGAKRPSKSRRRSKGKRKSSETRISLKKTKLEENDEEPMSSDFPGIENQYFRTDRSTSEPATSSPVGFHLSRKTHRSDSDQFKVNTFDQRNNTDVFSLGTPIGRRSTSGRLGRIHKFVSKTVIRAEKCNPCGRLIKFCKQALKCQDCRVICHPECRDNCPVPCIPTISTPTKGIPGSISDYTSSIAPMIPSLIVHCVSEIEKRGMKEIGLYRISGSEREVKDLKEKFLRGRTIPSLNEMDVHVICGTVKEFLRSLKEPLVPQSFWKIFVDAAEISDYSLSINALYDCVMDIPQPNRDTLAFLILHWQRIGKSSECKMPAENLAKVLGPTVIGYSSSNPAEMNMINETKLQFKVMQRLLSIPSDCWQNLLNVESEFFPTPTIKSPESIPAPEATRLGPIYTSESKSKVGTLVKTPFRSRNSKMSDTEKKRFFSSPLLK